jgi:endopeptidase Clp ATP-binding regulatory subunit ClpX
MNQTQKSLNEFVANLVNSATINASHSSRQISKKDDFIKNFYLKPSELIAYLQPRVIKQKKAIEILSATICNHYNAIRYRLEIGENPMDDVDIIKSNILLLGPSGSGKSLLVKSIAKKLGVPFERVDATKFSKTGYVGEDVEDIIRDLVNKTKDANGEPDIQLAQYGIVYIDEIDKIKSEGEVFDVGGKGVQQTLLTIIEDADIKLKSAMDMFPTFEIVRTPNGDQFKNIKKQESKIINTRNILFIFSGAFCGLEKIIEKRVNTSAKIGFNSEAKKTISSTDLLAKVTSEDLINFGLETEFVGRVPVRATLEEFDAEDLFQILKKPSPILIDFKNKIKAYNGTEVYFEDDVLRFIAEKAIKTKTGARELKTIFTEVTGHYEVELPEISVSNFTFTLEMVDGTYVPKEILSHYKDGVYKKMLTLQEEHDELLDGNDSICGYCYYIYKNHGLTILFDQETINIINQKAQKNNITPYQICKILFNENEHAFTLLKNNGLNKITINKEIFNDSKNFLSNFFGNQ